MGIGMGYSAISYGDESIKLDNYLVNLDLSSFDTSKVTNMSGMFAGFGLFGMNNLIGNLNLSSFDTSKVANMIGMFNAAPYLKTLDFRKATFDSVTEYYDSSDIGGMFDIWNFEGNYSINIITKNTITKAWLQERLNESNITGATITTVE